MTKIAPFLAVLLDSMHPTKTAPPVEPVAVVQQSQVVVVRIGEYPNKPGKRIYLKENELYLANNVRISKDSNGYFVSEYDINKKLALKVCRNLKKAGVNVVLLDAKDKTEDLNRAGRKAMSYNPSIYFSIHHNSYQDNSSGYFLMTNRNNTKEQKIAQSISDALLNNPTNIPRLENRVQDGYIGEMNETEGTINILYEGGFFSNKEELYKITDEEHTDYVAKQIATELIKVLSN